MNRTRGLPIRSTHVHRGSRSGNARTTSSSARGVSGNQHRAVGAPDHAALSKQTGVGHGQARGSGSAAAVTGGGGGGGGGAVMMNNSGRPAAQSRTRSTRTGSSRAGAPEVPQVIAGKYKLGHLLGEGSFGAIYFASHIHSGQQVAVKLETAKAHKQRRSQLEIECVAACTYLCGC